VLHVKIEVNLDTVQVFLPKCPLTTVRSTKAASNGCKRTLWKKTRVQVSDLYDNNWQLVTWQKNPTQQIWW